MDINNQSLKQEIGRIIAAMYYSSQEVRLTGMNRIRDVIRKKVEEIPPIELSKSEEDKYKKLYTDDKIFELLEQIKKDKVLQTEEQYYLTKTIELITEATKANERFKKLMEEYVETEPIYKDFLKHIRGISTVFSTKLIKEFGHCERFARISSLSKYCGYDVVCPKCVVEVEDIHGNKQNKMVGVNSEGVCNLCGSKGIAPKRRKGVTLHFSVQLRSMLWNITDSFIKQRTPVYREIYDAERARINKVLENNPDYVANQKQADFRARRKMVNLFLSNYWVAARELTGQEVTKPYVEDKLHHPHIITWQQVVAANIAAKPEKKEKTEGGKKRGRPKKESSEVTTEPTQPKKRGRPKKNES